jgi:phage baseplate assembly protein W
VPLQRVSQSFKDISMSFGANPLTNDLIAIKNANAISRSVRNIVMTIPGEKPFNPDFGSNVRNLLFENMDSVSAGLIVDEIRTSIQNFEPRVELMTVEALPDFDNNSYDVNIVYDIIGADIPPQELQFALESTR